MMPSAYITRPVGSAIVDAVVDGIVRQMAMAGYDTRAPMWRREMDRIRAKLDQTAVHVRVTWPREDE